MNDYYVYITLSNQSKIIYVKSNKCVCIYTFKKKCVENDGTNERNCSCNSSSLNQVYNSLFCRILRRDF